MRGGAIAVSLLILVSALAVVPVAAGSSSIAPINVISATWGTAGSPQGAGPGDQNLPLTVTLQSSLTLSASSVQGLLELPGGFSFYDGSNMTYSSFTQSVPPGLIFQMTFNSIFISQTLPLGTYDLSLRLWAFSGATLIDNQTSTVTVTVEGQPQLLVVSTSPSLAPGQVNTVPLTIYNNGTGAASRIEVSVSSLGAAVLNTLPRFNLSAGDSATYSLDLYVPSADAGALVPLTISSTYLNSYGIAGSSSQTIDLYGSKTTAPPLEFTAEQQSLLPGEVDNITVTLTNHGSSTVTQVLVTAALPSQSGVVLTEFSPLSSLAGGADSSWTVEVFVPASAAGTALQLSLSTTYDDSAGNSQTSTQNIGFFVSAATTSNSVTVTPLTGELKVGAQERVSFLVTNVGSTPVYSPGFSLTASTPLVVTGNSTYSMPGTSIGPGKSVVYQATFASDTTASPGYYTDTVSVTFENALGISVTNTFTSGVTLGGNIQIVIQDASASQSGSSLDVSGTLLNQGFTSAYYATVTGSLGASKTEVGQYYVGELDPNTPLAFSVTIPITSPTQSGLEQVNLTVSYRDSIGLESAYSAPVPASITPTSVTTATATASTSGVSALNLFEYGIVGILVVVIVVGALLVRRNRRATYSPRPTEPEEEKDRGVI